KYRPGYVELVARQGNDGAVREPLLQGARNRQTQVPGEDRGASDRHHNAAFLQEVPQVGHGLGNGDSPQPVPELARYGSVLAAWARPPVGRRYCPVRENQDVEVRPQVTGV